MRYLSVCSGIEAATVAWHPLGWTPVAFSEIEAFPSAVLAHHYPNIPNYGDMTQHEQWPITRNAVDLLVGGTPCQSFSVAGLRKGLKDPRGGLMLTYLEIAQRLRPRWVVWENVPGVLSSNGGRDFGSFVGALGELGYGWAYRVLDAQWCRTHRHPRAVPQRRRRVFVVGRLIERGTGDWNAAAAVCFESQSVQRNPSARRAAVKGIASDAESGTGAGGVYGGSDPTCADTVTSKWSKGSGGPSGKECGMFVAEPVPYDLYQITAPINRQNRQPGDPCHTHARDNAAHAAVAFQQNTRDEVRLMNGDGAIAGALSAEAGMKQQNYVAAIQGNLVGRDTGGPHGVGASEEGAMYTLTKADTHAVAVSDSLFANNNQCTGIPTEVVAHAMTVRRLTPRECERLQGFPDDYTAIPWRGKAETPDGPRYKALGNSMAVNCMEWIGERIAAWEAQ